MLGEGREHLDERRHRRADDRKKRVDRPWRARRRGQRAEVRCGDVDEELQDARARVPDERGADRRAARRLDRHHAVDDAARPAERQDQEVRDVARDETVPRLGAVEVGPVGAFGGGQGARRRGLVLVASEERDPSDVDVD